MHFNLCWIYMPLCDLYPFHALYSSFIFILSVCWSLNVMAGCLEHRHPSKNTKSLLAVERIKGRRRQLDFSHIRQMIPSGHLKRKKHANPKEVSLTSIVAKREAVGSRWLLVAASHGLQMIPYRPEQELSLLQTDMCLHCKTIGSTSRSVNYMRIFS